MEIKTFETSVKPMPNPRPVFCMVLSRQQENERRFRHSHIKLGGRLYGFIRGLYFIRGGSAGPSVSPRPKPAPFLKQGEEYT